MSPRNLPTLTEVVEVMPDDPALSAPLPLAPESMPLEMLGAPPPVVMPSPRLVSQRALVDAVVQRLQPRLDAWIEARAQALLAEALQRQVEGVAHALARELSAELPTLAREALDEVRKDVAARPPLP